MNHLYISSSGTPVVTKFTATQVRIVVSHVIGVHITVCMARTSFLCTLSASAFIETSLHGLGFFLEIILLWRPYYYILSLHDGAPEA